MIVDFTRLPLAINLAVFAAAAVFVWIAGTKISHYADAISAHTGLGHALLGLLLLGGVTSLPELAVSVSAAYSGSPTLAVNNIVGGVTMQVAILALADFAIGRRALTSVVPDPVVMLQGALNVLLLTIVPVGILVGDVSLLGIGAWAWAIFALTIFSVYKLSESEGRKPWRASNLSGKRADGQGKVTSSAKTSGSLSNILGKTAVAAAAILVAGFLIARTAEAIAEQICSIAAANRFSAEASAAVLVSANVLTIAMSAAIAAR
jgi:cation:H+ antiporter